MDGGFGIPAASGVAAKTLMGPASCAEVLIVPSVTPCPITVTAPPIPVFESPWASTDPKLIEPSKATAMMLPAEDPAVDPAKVFMAPTVMFPALPDVPLIVNSVLISELGGRFVLAGVNDASAISVKFPPLPTPFERSIVPAVIPPPDRIANECPVKDRDPKLTVALVGFVKVPDPVVFTTVLLVAVCAPVRISAAEV